MSIELQLNGKEFARVIERWQKNWARGVHFVFGVFDSGSDAHVGRIDVFLINKQLRWANLGFQIHEQYRSQGYAAEAGRSVLQFAFKHLNFHRIESATSLDNCAAANVAGKMGMTFEGVRRNFFPGRVGSHMKIFAMNAIEYENKLEG